MVWQVTMTTTSTIDRPLGTATSRSVPRALRSTVWICAGVAAVWLGNNSVAAWRTLLNPSGVIERSMIELFGSGFQWAALLALIPVMIWATGTRIETGLLVPLALLLTGNGVAAVEFLFVLVGTGLFRSLGTDDWQAASLGASGSMLIFALLNPWAAVFGLGVVALASAGKKSVALPSLVVLFPGTVAALLSLVFFTHGDPSLIDGAVAVGIVALHFSLLPVGVALVLVATSLTPVHPAAILADSFGVHVVDAPIEIAPDLLSAGFVIEPDARFALAELADGDQAVVGEADGWILVDASR